ncbi:MAG: hypothetical protein JW702_02945 [Clostridiales bacterium]|nr:hypothetical protein [Clostridiales bacterium]
MNQTLTEALTAIKENQQDELRDELIKEYFPFIIKRVSLFTKRYVNPNDSDELSVALDAFNESISRYDMDKGKFIEYAKLVIESRLIDYIKKNKKAENYTEELKDNVMDRKDLEKEYILKNEILNLSEELSRYGLSFQKLMSTLPKHQSTKMKAVEVAKVISENDELLKAFRENRNLPRIKIMKEIDVSHKQLKRSRNYIIAVVIVLTGEYESIREYLEIN